uniref:Ras association domain-containing protein 7-like n=1 Tax=Labrus bergylta TaxID=56723 RepID=A0A3Q3GJ19_9LABR
SILHLVTMELKVWVEGVARVVCGLSLNTSCQDVVIALAQSIGQTGRYVLILKLRGTERQMVADDCPLQQLAQLGQLAAEVRFVLRRTGPTLSDGQDTPTRQSGLPLPGSAEPDPVRSREPHKAFTFNLALERETDILNQEELMHREHWERQLQKEIDRERGTSSNMQLSMEDHSFQIRELYGRSAHLEQDLTLRSHRQSSQTGPRQPDEALRPLKQQLHQRLQQGDELDITLSETQKKLRAAEDQLQDRWEMIEELNKELRQCNLQQFIQQTGGPYADQTNSLHVTEVYLRNYPLLYPLPDLLNAKENHLQSAPKQTATVCKISCRL